MFSRRLHVPPMCLFLVWYAIVALLISRCSCAETGCNILRTTTYVEKVIEMKTCLPESAEAINAEIDLTTFAALILEKSTLDECLNTKNKEACDKAIAAANSSPGNTFLKYIGQSLVSDPLKTCACLVKFDGSFDTCSDVIDKYTTYCQTFFSTPSPTSVTIVAPKLAGQTKKQTVVDSLYQCWSTAQRACNMLPLPQPTATSSAPGSMTPLTSIFAKNNSLICLQQHFSEIEGQCSAIIHSMFTGIFQNCVSDLIKYCTPNADAMFNAGSSPAAALTCLYGHFTVISSACRSQLDELASNLMPCAEEAGRICPDKSIPEELMPCLSTAFAASTSQNSPASSTTSPTGTAHQFSNSCASIINGFNHCAADLPEIPLESGGGGGMELPPAGEIDAGNARKGDKKGEKGPPNFPSKKPKPGRGNEMEGGGSRGGNLKPPPMPRSLISLAENAGVKGIPCWKKTGPVKTINDGNSKQAPPFPGESGDMQGNGNGNGNGNGKGKGKGADGGGRGPPPDGDGPEGNWIHTKKGPGTRGNPNNDGNHYDGDSNGEPRGGQYDRLPGRGKEMDDFNDIPKGPPPPVVAFVGLVLSTSLCCLAYAWIKNGRTFEGLTCARWFYLLTGRVISSAPIDDAVSRGLYEEAAQGDDEEWDEEECLDADELANNGHIQLRTMQGKNDVNSPSSNAENEVKAATIQT